MNLKLKGVSYIEDLGHIKVNDKGRIKPHFLYRSAHLAKIDEKGIEKLKKHGITDVIDLRTDEEISIKKEDLGKNINYHHVALLDNEDNPAVTKETRLKVLLDRRAEEGGTKGYMTRFYSFMLANKKAQEGIRKVFDILANAKGGVIFHCTQGKDRTGIVLILLLEALRANKKTIYKEYMAYNRINWFFNFYVTLGMFLANGLKLTRSLRNLLMARKCYIEEAYKYLENNYQNPINYLKNVIHLTDEEIKVLRHKYVL